MAQALFFATAFAAAVLFSLLYAVAVLWSRAEAAEPCLYLPGIRGELGRVWGQDLVQYALGAWVFVGISVFVPARLWIPAFTLKGMFFTLFYGHIVNRKFQSAAEEYPRLAQCMRILPNAWVASIALFFLH